MYNQEIELVYYTREKNGKGVSVPTEVAVGVWADFASAGRQEAYYAMQNNIEGIILFLLREEDWNLCKHTVDGHSKFAEKIRYSGELFDFIKSFTKNGVTEVTCGEA